MNLPRADLLMAAILLGLMLAMSLGARLMGGVEGTIPLVALLAMPGTLTLVWFCYSASLAWVRRLNTPETAKQIPIAAQLMGKSMVVAGIVVTVTHAGMLAAFMGLLQGAETEAFLRLTFVGLGLSLAYIHNIMPKMASKARGKGPDLRLIGWVGTLCCLGMAVAGAVMPIDELTPVYLGLAMVSPTLVLISTAVWWFNRRPTG